MEGGCPVAFVAQDGAHNTLALAGAAKTKYGAAAAAAGGDAPPPKKQKVAAASATPPKNTPNKVGGGVPTSSAMHPIDASGVLQAAKDGDWKKFKTC